MLVLLGVPCSDSIDNERNRSYEIGVVQAHTHDGEDHCPPFCHCACCGFSTLAISFPRIKFEYSVRDFILTKSIAIRNPFFVSSYIGDIWQPPQI